MTAITRLYPGDDVLEGRSVRGVRGTAPAKPVATSVLGGFRTPAPEPVAPFVPIAATTALEIIGPTPGIVIKR